MKQRLEKLAEWLQCRNLDGIIVAKPENRRFFSGFSGSAGLLLITGNSRYLITDFRYVDQAEQQAIQYEIVRHGPSVYETLAQLIRKTGVRRLGFESDFQTWDSYQKMLEAAPDAVWVPVIPDPLRMVKDLQELACIRQAMQIADEAFQTVLGFLRPGIQEQEVAAELEYQMRKHGAERAAFDTIVASGIRSALPHGRASEKIIENGDFITMDFGAVYLGYHSDMTRTVVVGKASERQRKIYQVVLAAQLAGVQAVRPGYQGHEVDAVARCIIEQAGYAGCFGHGLGHGVGLAVHEEPRLSSTGNIVLGENMVVTVEPGVYIPGWGGVRIEDTVVVTATGVEILTTSAKTLLEL
ncbi:MAG TPA: Xaa-Pro peptidase family protein [Patescibacteria group bacterium]|nr:Xaa-Pro peptidase family protein [Patescibacteria group bacterium]